MFAVSSAGANTAYEKYFYATAAVLVDVPSWADRQALVADAAA
jgi:UDP-N-acetylglucosamine:LPS N-acetylglucosamine transferase